MVWPPASGLSLANFVRSRPALLKMIQPVANWYANTAGWRRMGLRHDDLIREENHIVQKALSRLPAEVLQARSFRLKRAMQQSVLHKDLPPNEWLKPEEDVRYLQPLIEQVEAEEAERQLLDNLVVERRLPGKKAH
ncbi:14 kDa subunit of cytochrome bd ubiquinol oxidase [Auriculariales sp. MPI-PUGE-AT-0066]|nr:14 kDa subunit of cytochrome bd ubiquinol oxidase [Auriculariales sp. MPI-PUGE-AT-0066]